MAVVRESRRRLSRAAVLDAARMLPPQEVTLAAVSARLGVTSPALYRYFSDRAGILEALAAETRERVSPPPADLPWDVWLYAAARTERDLWRTHSDLYASADYRADPDQLAQLVTAGVRVLVDAGFPPDVAFAGVTSVSELAHAIGHAETRRVRPSEVSRASTEQLRAVLGDLLPVDLDDLLERSVELVVTGLRARLP